MVPADQELFTTFYAKIFSQLEDTQLQCQY